MMDVDNQTVTETADSILEILVPGQTQSMTQREDLIRTLEDLWREAAKAGHEEGYDQGYEEGGENDAD